MVTQKERRGEWLTGVNTQNKPYLSVIATQHKTRQRYVKCLLMRVKARRRVKHVRSVLIMDKTRGRLSALARKVRINDG